MSGFYPMECRKCGEMVYGARFEPYVAGAHGERMRRTCGSCGYFWFVDPLDVKRTLAEAPRSEETKA